MLSSQLSLVPEPVVQVEYLPDEWGGSPVPSKPHFVATVDIWRGAGATEEDALAALAAELRGHVERDLGEVADFCSLAPASQVLIAAEVLDLPALVERLRSWATPATLASTSPERSSLEELPSCV